MADQVDVDLNRCMQGNVILPCSYDCTDYVLYGGEEKVDEYEDAGYLTYLLGFLYAVLPPTNGWDRFCQQALYVKIP